MPGTAAEQHTLPAVERRVLSPAAEPSMRPAAERLPQRALGLAYEAPAQAPVVQNQMKNLWVRP